MSDDEILQLASDTSGPHHFDHAHVIRFARAVMGKSAIDREATWHAVEALRNAHAYSVTHEEFENGVLDVIDALRAALGDADAA